MTIVTMPTGRKHIFLSKNLQKAVHMNILYTKISSQVLPYFLLVACFGRSSFLLKAVNDTPLGLKAFELLEPDSDSQKTTE